MNTYDKHMKQYAKVPGTRAGPGVRKIACTALATMGTDQALTPEAKESISATFSAVATNDSDLGALHPRR